MQHFIKKLKRDQLSIINTLEKANITGLYTSSGASLVKEARRKINRHVDIDIGNLRNKIARNPQSEEFEDSMHVLKRLMIYQNELRRFSRKFTKFTESGSRKHAHSHKVSYDFPNLIATLKQRFKKDETEITQAANLIDK